MPPFAPPPSPSPIRLILCDHAKAEVNNVHEGDMQAARKKFVAYCAGLVKTDFRTYKSSPLSTFPLILRNKANVQQVSGGEEQAVD